MYRGITINNFIFKEDCEFILNYLNNDVDWNITEDQFWNGRVFSPNKLNLDNLLRIKLSEILKKVKQEIINVYGIEKVYADTFDIIKWPEGSSQAAHIDDMTDAGQGYDFFHHRKYASLIYLNDDFIGGETHYPQYGIEIKPEPGKLALHLGDKNHLHGVHEIKNGIRYTIAGFWGEDPQYDNEY